MSIDRKRFVSPRHRLEKQSFSFSLRCLAFLVLGCLFLCMLFKPLLDEINHSEIRWDGGTLYRLVFIAIDHSNIRPEQSRESNRIEENAPLKLKHPATTLTCIEILDYESYFPIGKNDTSEMPRTSS